MVPLLFPPEVLFTISLPAWRALFDAFGVAAAVGSHDDVDALLFAGAPPELAEALSVVEPLASALGGAMLARAADALGLGASSIPRAASLSDLAALVVAFAAGEDRRHHPLSDLIACAETEMFRAVTWPRMARELRVRDGADASVVPGHAAMATRLGEALEDPSVLGVRAIAMAGGGMKIEVRRAAPAPPLVAFDPRTHALGAPSLRLVSDRLEWAPPRRVLRVDTDDPARVATYGAAFGVAAADDPSFVTAEPTTSLARLRELGPRALHTEAFALEIKEVRLTALRWDSGDFDIATLEGRDVFAGLESRAWHILGGSPLAAQLRVVLASGKRISAVVWPPNRVHVPAGPHAGLVWRLLDALGLTWIASPPSPRARRLWSADPFIATHADWPRAIGDDYARLAALEGPSVFAAHQVRALAHPEYPHHGRVLVAMPRGDGEAAYGASFDPDVPSRVVPLSELEAVRLDLFALATHLARGLELEGGVRAIEGRGCFLLGRRAFGSKIAEVTFLPRDPGGQGPALFSLVTLRADETLPVLLVPPGCRVESDVRQVALRSLAPPYHETLADIVRVVGAGSDVAPHVVAPKGVPLVLDARTNEVWLAGTRIARATELHVKLLLALARGGPSTAKEIAAAMQHKGGSDSAIPQIIARLLAAFRKSLREAKAKAALALVDGLIVHDRRGYRLGVAVFVRT